jgi:2-polyprenyl-6-methoxyphenol hydroxylase-like FAD-dependent oxidoreductase
VLVVGAGPTGLVLAAELLARGIRTRVIDKGDGVALQSRAIGLHARTLEVLDMMGLADRLVEHGHVVRYLRFYSAGRCLVSFEFARCGSRFGFLLDLPQDQTERLLRARVAELGGKVEQETELTGLTTRGCAVTAAVRGSDGRPQAIEAEYVVGCDGAHSRVRGALGLTFHGHPYPQDWLLADVLLDWEDLAEDSAHAFFRADGLPVIFFPMRGHRWRLTLPFAGSRSEQAPTLEEIQRLTGQRAPRPVTVSDPTWLASFRCHRRSADAYRRGRVLLVRYGTMSHPVKRRVRDIVVPALGRNPVIQRRAARRLSQVYVAYPPGPLARDDRGRGRPRAGQRMPDIQVRAGGQPATLHGVLRGGRHVLVVPAAHEVSVLSEAALRPFRADLDVVTADGATGPVILVRPDGHVAAQAGQRARGD